MDWEVSLFPAMLGAAGVLAYGVRAKSSTLLAPSIYKGPSHRKAIALTFDDGPSESTPELLDLLESHGAHCTFFQCGRNVERLPEISRRVLAGRHEIGNHTYSHSPLYFRDPQFISDEIYLCQNAVTESAGCTPSLFRAPYGARWFGLRAAQQRFQLQGVMWTHIACDWKLTAPEIHARLKRGLRNGSILCLHDGRELAVNPDIRPTIEAVRLLLPDLAGYQLLTVSELLCLKTQPNA